MKLFNSMSQTMEEFQALRENEVWMYVCGPTVYNYAHIGNARPIVVFDTLKRTFEAIGYNVKMVSNYTDVDDKIIHVAKEHGVSEKEITETFIRAYNSDRQSLHAMLPDAAPKVTDVMEAIIAFIQLLEEKGYAYAVDGDVYFRVDRVKGYGNLSNQQMKDVLVGARIEENNKKESPLDFTLWKQTQEGIQWDSPWSFGRPGWHTECVVMINQEFGAHTIDIHGGGMDLKFPHHENEVAQSLAAYDTTIANYWMHNGMVNIDGEKMSKSLGNVILVKDLIAEISGNILRWVMLSAHYRAPLHMNEATIETAKKECNKVQMSLKQAYVKIALAEKKFDDVPSALFMSSFLSALQDDLNTPNAFAALFEAVKDLNQEIRQKEVDYIALSTKACAIETMLGILGIDSPKVNIDAQDILLHKQWQGALHKKDYKRADMYRAKLIQKGIL